MSSEHVTAAGKRATAGLWRYEYELENERLDEVGERQVLLDSEERPLAIVVIDRVGTGSQVPICTGSRTSSVVADRIADAGRRTGTPWTACTNLTSDHRPFELRGIPAVRIGPDSYPQYHTGRDTPEVLDAGQIERAGTIAWEALRSFVPA